MVLGTILLRMLVRSDLHKLLAVFFIWLDPIPVSPNSQKTDLVTDSTQGKEKRIRTSSLLVILMNTRERWSDSCYPMIKLMYLWVLFYYDSRGIQGASMYLQYFDTLLLTHHRWITAADLSRPSWKLFPLFTWSWGIHRRVCLRSHPLKPKRDRERL